MSLSSTLNTALSGIRAADAMAGAAASNIANLSTPGYKARRVDLEASPAGGVRGDRVTIDPSPGAVDEEGEGGSNVDLAREAVELMRSKTMYAANAAVVKAADSMLGTLIDIVDSDRRGGRAVRD